MRAVISSVATDGTTLAGPSVFAEDFEQDWDDAGGEEEDHAGLEIRLSVPVLGGGGALAGEKTRKQLKSELRDANTAAVRDLVRFTSLDHRQVNAELNRLGGVAKVSEATYEQLERRLRAAEAWLRRL